MDTLDLHFVDEDELRDERAGPQVLVLVEVWDVAHNKMPTVELDRVSLVDEALQVFVTTDQFVKH